MDLAGSLDRNGSLVEIHADNVPGFQRLAEPLGEFAGIELPGRDAIAEKNSGEAFSQDDFASGGAQCDGCMFARAAAAEIPAGHNDWILRVDGSRFDEANGVKGVGQTA